MDFRKYSQFLDKSLTALLDDLEKTAGKEVNELPPKQTVLAGSRFILKGDPPQEYIKLSDGEYHLLGGGGTGDIGVSFQKTATHIQYSVNDGESWVDLVPLSEITGPAGADGSDGSSAYVYIAYASDDTGTDFTTTFNPLLDYIAILTTDTEIVTPQVSDFTGLWKNYKGEAGTDAKNIELRIDSGYIQWRYIGETWTNLIAVSEITGADGQDINHVSFTSTTGTGQGEAGQTDTYTVWGDAGETINLGTFNVYNGEDGTAGVGVPAGGTTGQVLKKIDGTDYNTEWADESGGSASLPDDVWLILAKNSLDNLEIKSGLSLDPATKKNIIEDIFSDTTGYKNTVDILNTNASFVPTKYTNEGGYAIDITAMTFQGIGDSVALQEPGMASCFIKPDGTKLYTIGSGSDGINQYSVGTPFDMTTLAHDKYFSTAAQEITPRSLFFKPDGTKFYIAGIRSTVYEYDLSIAWDIGTAIYNNVYYSLGLNTGELRLSYDGLNMYIRYIDGNTIRQYSLSTAWNISTATYVNDFSFSSQDSNMASFVFDSTGTILIACGRTNVKFFQYSLSTAWDVTTLVYSNLSYSYTTDLGTALPNALSLAGNNSYLIVGLVDETITSYSFPGSAGGDVQVVTEAQVLSFTPTKFMIVPWRESVIGTGSINFDISFDNGLNEQVGLNANTVTAITNTGTSLILTINLLAGISSGVAEIQGYAVIIW